MKYDKNISSSEDKFDFLLLNDEIIFIYAELNDIKTKVVITIVMK